MDLCCNDSAGSEVNTLPWRNREEDRVQHQAWVSLQVITPGKVSSSADWGHDCWEERCDGVGDACGVPTPGPGAGH